MSSETKNFMPREEVLENAANAITYLSKKYDDYSEKIKSINGSKSLCGNPFVENEKEFDENVDGYKNLKDEFISNYKLLNTVVNLNALVKESDIKGFYY
jgi:hypothetical protein